MWIIFISKPGEPDPILGMIPQYDDKQMAKQYSQEIHTHEPSLSPWSMHPFTAPQKHNVKQIFAPKWCYPENILTQSLVSRLRIIRTHKHTDACTYTLIPRTTLK